LAEPLKSIFGHFPASRRSARSSPPKLLFSQDEEDGIGQRELGFSREELISYIRELYAEWSSISLYATETDDAEIMQIVVGFEEFIAEAQSIALFDELLNSNFLNRLRIFKESVNENFYAPPVAAVAVELNINLGNRYVDLLEKEKQKEGIVQVENRYGGLYDHTVSEATGKTLTIAELLKQRRAAPRTDKPIVPAAPESLPKKEVSAVTTALNAAKPGNARKWILAALLTMLVALGIYFVSGR
ncbi:MAG: hypothetical protein M3T96_08220, partial [Acidobacteriota bacterium]|nr:hypothetical protein [Acidobacteriota bacterium]